MSPDGKSILVPSTNKSDDTNGLDVAVLLDAATGKEIRRFASHERWIRGASFTPDGVTLVTWDAKQPIRLWDAATGEKSKQYPLINPDTRGLGSAVRTIWPSLE